MSCVAQSFYSWSATSPIGFVLRRLARRFARGVALLAALGAAALAQAQTPYATIANASGPITNIFVGDDLSLQVEYDGYTAYQVFPSATKPGDYGTFVVIGNTLYAPDFSSHGGSAAGVYGASTEIFTPVSQTPVAGAGTSASPYTVTTTAAAGTTGVQIVETVTYVVGDEFFHTSTKLTNSTTDDQTVLLYRAMDCYLGGSDSGFGMVAPGMIACTKNENNDPPGMVEGFTFTPGPDVHYMEATYSTIWSQIRAQDAFPDTVYADSTDNGMGVSWELTVPAGGSVTVAGNTLFLPTGVFPLDTQISANPGSVTPGGQVTYTVTVTNANSSDVTLESLTSMLPSGFSYVSGSAEGDLAGHNPAIAGQTLEWAGAAGVTVPANGTLVFTFVANVASSVAAGSYTASVEGTATNPAYAVTPDQHDALVAVLGGGRSQSSAAIPSLSELALALLALLLAGGAALEMRRRSR